MVAIGAWILGFVALAIAALAGCGHIPPTPPTPVGQASCVEGCHHQADDLHCDTSVDLCERICGGAAPNNPGYPTCLANAASCAEAGLCQ